MRFGPDNITADYPQVDMTQTNWSGSVKVGPSSTKAKAKRKQSSIWDHFDMMIDEVTKKIKVQYKYCPSTFVIVEGSSSSLIWHAKKYAPNSGTKDPKQSRISTAGSTISIDNSSYPPLDREVNRFIVMKMIVCIKLLFSFTESPWSTEIANIPNPDMFWPHRIPVKVLW